MSDIDRASMRTERRVEEIELELLLEALFRRWGYDFRSYSRVHLRRRVVHFLESSGCASLSALQGDLLRDKELLRRFLVEMSIQVSEMFRDPRIYREIREKIIPILATYPQIRIWHAGCASGEEVFSMAIMLEEEGLLKRTQIYATDFNEDAVRTAREGVFPAARMRDFTENYLKAGGRADFSDYYSANYDGAIMAARLRKAVTFAHHNLATDGVFGEMNMVVCRNVLIYFDKNLQDRVLKLFRESLCLGGVLWIGSKESLRFSSVAECFEPIREDYRIYRKSYDECRDPAA